MPLATFVLFAYNQEEYIREAVNGALSQTYQPLEIIISDDYSNDKTFEIIREMSEAYVGPHRLIVRQSKVNRGFIHHINDVSKYISSNIVIFAAGDDISYPDRTKILVDYFINDTNVMAVYSSFDEIGRVQNDSALTTIDCEVIPLLEFVINGGFVYIGATFAYRRQCLYWPGKLPYKIKNEDSILPFRAAILGNVIFLDKPLVGYRKPEGKNQILIKQKRNLDYYNYNKRWTFVGHTITTGFNDGYISKNQWMIMVTLVNIKKIAIYLRSNEKSVVNVVIRKALNLIIFCIKKCIRRHKYKVKL